MGDYLELIKNKRNLISLLILLIMIVAIYAFITFRQQQIIKSRAAASPIVFSGDNVTQKTDGTWVAKKPNIAFQLTSPLGPQGNYACNVNYTLNPSTPGINASISVQMSVDSPNSACAVLYLDNKPQPVNSLNCTPGSEGLYDCGTTITSGSKGSHIVQLKFGQQAAYSGVICNEPVSCNPVVYQAKAPGQTQ